MSNPVSGGEVDPLRLSMFNVDLTAYPDITAQIIGDVAAAGFEPIPVEEGAPAAVQRYALEKWYTGKSFEQLRPVMDLVKAGAAERISPVVKLMIQAERQHRHHDIGLWSAILQEDIVEAIADGLERDLGIDVAVVKGATFEKDEQTGLYTGKREGIYKAQTLEELAADEAERGGSLELHMVADSFRNARPALVKGKHPVLIDPSDVSDRVEMGRMDTIINGSQEGIVFLQKGDKADQSRFDLRHVDGKLGFLEDLYYGHDD